MYNKYRDDIETKHASPKADWSPITNVNSKCFQPSGKGLSRASTSNNIAHHEDATLGPPRQAVNKVKINTEMLNKDHVRETKED